MPWDKGGSPGRQVGAAVPKVGGVGHPTVPWAFQTSQQKTVGAHPRRLGRLEPGSTAARRAGWMLRTRPLPQDKVMPSGDTEHLLGGGSVHERGSHLE